jgi:phosphoribosylanthranilate isomerase
VDFAGFIFYPKSPRYVLNKLRTAEIKKIRSINKVGVFVNASESEVLRMVDECGLHMIQIHGDESPLYCDNLANYITVIKAFRLSDNDAVEWMVKSYMDYCDMFLFDTLGVGYGGTGKKFNWQQIENSNINKSFFLSGGIEPADVASIKKFALTATAKSLFALDINSKFETAPGYKDMNKIKMFVENLRT